MASTTLKNMLTGRGGARRGGGLEGEGEEEAEIFGSARGWSQRGRFQSKASVVSKKCMASNAQTKLVSSIQRGRRVTSG